MTKRTITPPSQMAKMFGISEARAVEALMKAQLLAAIRKAVIAQELTHVELSKRSKIPRTAVTGMLSGGLQKITIDRVLRLADAAGLKIELKITSAA